MSPHTESHMRSVAHSIERRRVLTGAGAALLAGVLDGCGVPMPATRVAMPAGRLQLPALRADIDRITAITVCTRPFRPEGPRLDVERVGDQTIVHNYGHGGRGWSLSWGSYALATGTGLGPGARGVYA